MFCTRIRRSSKPVIEQLLDQAKYFGVDEKIAYDPSLPVDLFQQSLHGLHAWLGSSWPAVCLAMAAGFRLLTMPVFVRDQLNHTVMPFSLGIFNQTRKDSGGCS
jgi:hypothetical protein